MQMKSLIAAVKLALFGTKAGRFVGRARVTDTITYPYTTLQYRMAAGFPGDVNRSHPASVIPAVNSATAPVLYPGQGCVVDTATNTIRALAAGDTAVTDLYGITVRSYPTQVSSASAYGSTSFGVGTLPAGQAVDVLRQGYILGQLNASAGVPTKGGAVFIWVAATSGGHTQGGFETAASAGNTLALDTAKYQYNGSADANGVVEISIVG